MSEPFVFDPRCDRCKTPFGAVTVGAEVTLHVRPLQWENFSRCTFLLTNEFSKHSQDLNMPFSGIEGDRACFSLTFSAPAEPDLVWYRFRLEREDGTGCELDKTGYRSDGLCDPWQLTVYDGRRATPDWFGEGVTYQIFPDRFCRLELPDLSGMVGQRILHDHWDDVPEWRPDERGEVRNRDFFGGSLRGVLSKLDYLEGLGVTTLYFCPIFESASNHRYNTADYMKIDPALGTEEDFRALCAAARLRGMRVILDGVFNHTGSTSVYFNADGFYPGSGAAQSQDSPYYSWYSFHPWPHDYDAWWGIRTLPAVNEADPLYRDFIFEGQDSVIRHWLRCGASGWRLDVADELPDEFIVCLRNVLEETDPDAMLLGEVWEDGSNKIAYSKRRRYLLGDETHGLMNYPFRTAALQYLLGGDASLFRDAMETIRENYPAPAFYSAMNFLGTHDTPRILTVLGGGDPPPSKDARAVFTLSPSQRERGMALLKIAAALLFAFPGSPTVYYGDETGMEGWEDPFNRRAYPWGREDDGLRAWYALLGRLRHTHPSLRRGDIQYLRAEGRTLVFSRSVENETTLAAFNAGDEPVELTVPWSGAAATDALAGAPLSPGGGALTLRLPPLSAALVV